MRAAGATKTTTVTAMSGGTNNNQLKAIKGSGRNGGGGGSGDGGNGNGNRDSNCFFHCINLSWNPMYYEIEPGRLLQEGAHIHVVTSQVNQIDLYYGHKPNSG